MALLGHEVIHNGEDSLFHLAGILSSKNDHFSLLKIEGNTSIAVNIWDVLVCMELASVENVVISSIGEVLLEFFFSGFNEHVGHEKGMVGTSADDSNTDSLFEVIAGVTIDDVESLSGVEIVSGEVFEDSEGAGSHGDVDFSPGDFLFTNGVLDDSFGVGRSAKIRKKIPSLGSRVGNEGTSAGKLISSGFGVRGDVVNTVFVVLGDAKLGKGITRDFGRCWG